MSPEGSGPALGRRSMLAAALSVPLLAGGCSKGFGALGTPPHPKPEVAVLTGAITAERALIARYHAVLERLPALAATMNPLLAEHQAHLAALTARLVPGAARPSPSPTASQAPPAVPGSTTAATAYLGAAEQAAASQLLGHLVRVSSPALAQLLASVAASEATHAAALGVRVSLS